MVLLKQRDQKRTIQISQAAGTYLVIPDAEPPMPAADAAAAATPAGVVAVATTIVDTGERKTIFGRQARRVRTTIDRQPMPGACDPAQQRIDTDGWYIDPPAPSRRTAAGGAGHAAASWLRRSHSADDQRRSEGSRFSDCLHDDDYGRGRHACGRFDGDHRARGATLDHAVFEIPPGLNGAATLHDLGKAMSDVREAKLMAADSAPRATPASRAGGVVRVGVPEFTNKTGQQVDTRALRARLIAALADGEVDAQPMAAAPQSELQKRDGELGYDYVLLADVAELKASKPGRLGGLMRAASGVAGGRVGGGGAAVGAAGAAAAAPKENSEANIAVRLVQPDGTQRLSTTTEGKDGSGFSRQTGLGLARFAGTMYVGLFMGPAMSSRLNAMGLANMGGVGVLGNPLVHQMQRGGLYGTGAGMGMGIDATADAASYLMQQAMAMNDAAPLVGMPGQGPSFEDSLGEALDGAAKAVARALRQNS